MATVDAALRCMSSTTTKRMGTVAMTTTTTSDGPRWRRRRGRRRRHRLLEGALGAVGAVVVVMALAALATMVPAVGAVPQDPAQGGAAATSTTPPPALPTSDAVQFPQFTGGPADATSCAALRSLLARWGYSITQTPRDQNGELCFCRFNATHPTDPLAPHPTAVCNSPNDQDMGQINAISLSKPPLTLTSFPVELLPGNNPTIFASLTNLTCSDGCITGSEALLSAGQLPPILAFLDISNNKGLHAGGWPDPRDFSLQIINVTNDNLCCPSQIQSKHIQCIGATAVCVGGIIFDPNSSAPPSVTTTHSSFISTSITEPVTQTPTSTPTNGTGGEDATSSDPNEGGRLLVIGIGAAVGIIAVLGLCLAVWILTRRRQDPLFSSGQSATGSLANKDLQQQQQQQPVLRQPPPTTFSTNEGFVISPSAAVMAEAAAASKQRPQSDDSPLLLNRRPVLITPPPPPALPSPPHLQPSTPMHTPGPMRRNVMGSMRQHPPSSSTSFAARGSPLKVVITAPTTPTTPGALSGDADALSDIDEERESVDEERQRSPVL